MMDVHDVMLHCDGQHYLMMDVHDVMLHCDGQHATPFFKSTAVYKYSWQEHACT